MGRPSIPVGQTGKLRYQVRQALEEPWRSTTLAAARNAGWTRNRAGRAWRALQTVGTPEGARTVSRIAPTHSEAADAVEAAVQEVVEELSKDPAAPTLATMLEWVRKRIADGADPAVTSPRSTKQYLAVLGTWCGLGPRDADAERSHPYRTSIIATPIADLTPGDLHDELEAIAAAGGTTAMRQVRAMWRKATARALSLRLIMTDPAAGLVLPPAPPRGTKIYKNGAPRRVDNALTAKEEDALRDALDNDDRAQAHGIADLIVLALETGARISEVASIRWDDVTGTTVVLTGQIDRIPEEGLRWREGLKTGPDSRTIPLTSTARTLLDRRRTSRSENPDQPGSWLVFTSPKGKMPDPDNIASAVRKTLDRAQLPWATVHTLRRTVENRLMDSGTDPRLIERIMGHTSGTAHRAYWNRGLDPKGALDGLERRAHTPRK